MAVLSAKLALISRAQEASSRATAGHALTRGSALSTARSHFATGQSLGHPPSSLGLNKFGGSRHRRSQVCSRAQYSVSDSGPDKVDIFQVPDPREILQPVRSNWDVLLNDVRYLDWRARQDALAIKTLHDKVVEVLNPAARERKSMATLKEQLAELQQELAQAHAQVHLSEARVEHTMARLQDLEAVVSSRVPKGSVKGGTEGASRAGRSPVASTIAKDAVQEGAPSGATVALPVAEVPKALPGLEGQDWSEEQRKTMRRKNSFLEVSGPPHIGSALKNFWYPVCFSVDLKDDMMIPIESFEEPWVLFRGPSGKPGCIRDECAHRACPLSLGAVVEGRVQCPYHGWEYGTSGDCEHMPSTVKSATSVKALPCIEQDGMVWIWPGPATPEATLPCLAPPPGYTIHAQITLEVPVEHGLLVENLLDLAHAPFTHTTTFAKGWSVPNLVTFKTAARAALRGNWDPYPIDMEFRPPCMVLSTIGLAQPGKLEGSSAQECSKHLHQLHVCMPSKRGKTRLLYRMALDFAGWVKYIPFIDRIWEKMAQQVLGEDLRLVVGQQDRMIRGANVWNHPVGYDKLGVRYRKWRHAVERGEEDEKVPF